jgi:hypothetical protein
MILYNIYIYLVMHVQMSSFQHTSVDERSFGSALVNCWISFALMDSLAFCKISDNPMVK